MEYFFVEFLTRIGLCGLKGDFLVAEEHEVIDKYLRCFFDCILGQDRTVGAYLESQFVVVGFLVYAIVFDGVFDVFDRGVD